MNNEDKSAFYSRLERVECDLTQSERDALAHWERLHAGEAGFSTAN